MGPDARPPTQKPERSLRFKGVFRFHHLIAGQLQDSREQPAKLSGLAPGNIFSVPIPLGEQGRWHIKALQSAGLLGA